MGNRLTLQSDDRHGCAEPGLQKEGKILYSPRAGHLPAARLIPTHRHVRPAPCIPRFGNGVHKLSTNAKVTEFNISISVQKNIGRFDVCKGKKFKPASQGWRFKFQEQQLQRTDTGSAAQSPSPLGMGRAGGDWMHSPPLRILTGSKRRWSQPQRCHVSRGRGRHPTTLKSCFYGKPQTEGAMKQPLGTYLCKTCTHTR